MPRSFLVKKAERVRVDKSFFCDPEDEEDEYEGSYSDSYGYGDSYGFHGNVIRAQRSCPSPEPVTNATSPYTPTLQPLVVRLTNGYIHDLSTSSVHTTNSSQQQETIQVPKPVTETVITSLDDVQSDSEPLSLVTRTPASHTSESNPSLPSDDENQEDKKENKFQDGVTIGYTYDAFFITDGRSKKKAIKPEVVKIPKEKSSKSKYSCNECGKQYATSSNLSRHKQTHRSLDSKNAKTCPHCSKVYVSMPALSMHILTHDLRHQCPICDKAFSRPWLLQGHMRSHSGEKPYGCAHCGKAFADRSNLRAHMQTHSSYKSYKCKRCEKTFALKSYLNKHLESACLKDAESEDSPCSPQSTSSHGSV